MMQVKETILIFGVSSFVGSSLAEFFKNDYKVIGTYHSEPVWIEGVTTIPVDIIKREQVQLAIFTFRPKYTIYAVGLSSLTECEQNTQMADALNTAGLFNVAENSQRYKSRLVYISSSFIFAGLDKTYLEKDTPDPNTAYGNQVASAEFYIQKNCLNYIIFRCCQFYGKSLRATRPNFFEQVQTNIAYEKEFYCDDNLRIGFLDIYYLGMCLKIAFTKGIKNRLFQIASKDVCTYYEFARYYSKVFKTNEDLIQKGRWKFPLRLLQAGDRYSESPVYQLDVKNLEGFFKVSLPSIGESLLFTYQRFHGKKKKNSLSSSSGDIKFI
jgi:dTDP-4-dehydrorhamnose reductase